MQGGLGNQLFCLAFARSVRLLTGDPVALDLSSYGADRFGNAFVLEDLARQIDGLVLDRQPMLGNRFSSALLRRLPFPIPGYAAEPPEGLSGKKTLVSLARPRGYFDGYWQDEAYIHDPGAFASLVRDFLLTGSTPRPEVAVALHYRTYKEENHPVRSRAPGRDYFVRAIETLESASGPVSRIDLISDDPALALERIGDIGRQVVPVVGGGARDDMALILGARALILTNSSFSWWGGFCGVAQTVVYPERRGLFHYPIPAGRFVRV
jgi:hypothetical protein